MTTYKNWNDKMQCSKSGNFFRFKTEKVKNKLKKLWLKMSN